MGMVANMADLYKMAMLEKIYHAFSNIHSRQ